MGYLPELLTGRWYQHSLPRLAHLPFHGGSFEVVACDCWALLALSMSD